MYVYLDIYIYIDRYIYSFPIFYILVTQIVFQDVKSTHCYFFIMSMLLFIWKY